MPGQFIASLLSTWSQRVAERQMNGFWAPSVPIQSCNVFGTTSKSVMHAGNYSKIIISMIIKTPIEIPRNLKWHESHSTHVLILKFDCQLMISLRGTLSPFTFRYLLYTSLVNFCTWLAIESQFSATAYGYLTNQLGFCGVHDYAASFKLRLHLHQIILYSLMSLRFFTKMAPQGFVPKPYICLVTEECTDPAAQGKHIAHIWQYFNVWKLNVSE